MRHHGEVSEPDDDERGYFTVRLDGGPALAGNLAVAVRISARKDWPHSPDMRALLMSFAAVLDTAEFTPVRAVEIRQRSPQEARERLLSSPLPPDLAQALADEIESAQPCATVHDGAVWAVTDGTPDHPARAYGPLQGDGVTCSGPQGGVQADPGARG